MLRFMADEYDDTCSTVFPLLQTILLSVSSFIAIRRPLVSNNLLQYKRQRKSSTDPLEPSKRSFLSSLLTVILEKLKWDEESDPEDMDEDDKAAFEGLRKVGGVSTYDDACGSRRILCRSLEHSWIPCC